MSNLDHAFSYASAEHHMIRDVLMVGAVPGAGCILSEKDRWILRSAMLNLDEWKIPLQHDLQQCLNPRHEPSSLSVSIHNILPEYGGRNFQSSQEKASIVVFCNVPGVLRDQGTLSKDYNHPLTSQYRGSHTVSEAHNDLNTWQEAIARSDAKIIMVHGSDSFSLPELNNGDYAEVRIDDALGFLIKKTYLEEAETYLLLQDSPLQPLVPMMEQKTAFTYNFARQQVSPAI